jgi:hypothetical protein
MLEASAHVGVRPYEYERLGGVATRSSSTRLNMNLTAILLPELSLHSSVAN